MEHFAGSKPGSEELHSLFYSLEGMLLLGVCRPESCHWKLAAERFELIFENELRNNCLPPSGEDCFESQSDVLGQALRIGSILMSHGFLRRDAWKERLTGVARSCRI
jgi:hypothetical protein